MTAKAELFSPLRVKVGLALLLLLAFWGPATGLATFIYRDFGVLAWPTAAYHREMFWRGELPLWNPYSNCGVPFLAQWGTMALYPFSLFYLLLPLPWSLNFFCLAHLWLGGLGVYFLANKWTRSAPAATFAAILFVFNGITQSTLSWPNYTAAFGWMPWIIYFFCAHRSVPLTVLTGTMQMLTGVPEVIVLTWIIATTLQIHSFWIDPRHRRTLLICSALTITLIAALSAIQLLPFFELLNLSQRQTGVGPTKWAVPFSALPNFALPMLHAFKTPQATWFQYDQHFLSSTYLGLSGIALAILGARSGGTRTLILATISVICAALALGPNLPLYGLLQKAPLLGLARYPVKFLLALPLLVSVLAAFALSRPFSKKPFLLVCSALFLLSVGLIYSTKAHPLPFDHWPSTYPNTVIRLLAFALIAKLLYHWSVSQQPSLYFAVLVLIFSDGRFHLQNQNPTVESSTLRAGIREQGLPKLGQGRAFISPQAEQTLLNSSVPDLKTDFIGKQLTIWSHLNLVALVPKVNGSATLNLRAQKDLQDQLYAQTNSINLQEWLDSLAVTHITRPGSAVEWTNRASALPLVRGESSEIEVTSFDFQRNEVTARALAKSPGSVLIMQSWHPAWRAFVNGNGAQIQKSNLAFQSVAVSVGESEIRLHYRPPWLGAAISLASLAACCGLLWLEKKRA